VIEQKYLSMLEQLNRAATPPPLEPLPGWLGRRKKTLRPAADILSELPAGPVVGTQRGQP
jgi:hypothetical protein